MCDFSEEDFTVNMGDKIAQLIFEKIKTPTIQETNDLDDTGRGDKGFGSIGIRADQVPRYQVQDSVSENR